MEQLLIAFVQRVEWAQELLKENCGERKALWCARRRIPMPRVGIDAPTPARIGTCRPMGRSHFSFGGERKVCKRKPAARRLREKALYCPFLKEGVRNVARSMVKLPTFTFVRARAHSNPLSKRARLFPSAAYRRSAPPQLAVGRLTPCGLGWFPVGWPILEGHRPAGSAGASHEACRRMAVCTRQAAGSRTRPASREACRRAAVKPRPSRMSHEHPARRRRAVRLKALPYSSSKAPV